MSNSERKSIAITSALFALVVGLVLYIQRSNGERLDRMELETVRLNERVDLATKSVAAIDVRLEFIQRDLAKVLLAVELIQKQILERK